MKVSSFEVTIHRKTQTSNGIKQTKPIVTDEEVIHGSHGVNLTKINLLSVGKISVEDTLAYKRLTMKVKTSMKVNETMQRERERDM